MNISFLEDDPLDTVINNSADGRSLYEVYTPGTFKRPTTFIRRTVPGVPAGSAELVAEVHWRSDTIHFGGAAMPIGVFLRKSGFWSSSKVMTGTDGREYKWRLESNKLSLVNNDTKVVIAEHHHSKSGWFSTPRKMNIDIRPPGLQILDVIVVSFIIMERARRKQANANANNNFAAAAGAAASASAAAAPPPPSC